MGAGDTKAIPVNSTAVCLEIPPALNSKGRAAFVRCGSGEIVLIAPCGFAHSRRQACVFHQLFSWAERDGRGVAVGSDAAFTLPDGSFLTAAAGWIEASRIAALTEMQRELSLPFAPDFVLEILSPTDSLAELDAKMECWTANGVGLAWRIDPFARNATIFAADYPRWVIDRPDIVDGTGPMAGFQLSLGRVWAA